MKHINCVFPAIFLCGAALADNNIDNDYQPTIYADVSQKAQENAMKYGGFHVFGGLCYAATSFRASADNGSSNTKQDFNTFMFTLGLSGTYVFKQNFLGSLSFSADICGSKKKNDSWSGLNADYAAQRGAIYSRRGGLTGELKTPSINFEVSGRLGYIFRKLTSYAFLKVGAARVEGTYRYRAGADEISKVKAVGFVPLIGFGGGKNFNKKFGVMLEVNFPISRTEKKRADFVQHKIKMGKRTIRLLGTYAPNISF